MNENHQLAENETILLMRDGRGGKTVGGTRVFKDLESFARYLRADNGYRGKHWVDFFTYKEVGQTVTSGKKTKTVTKAGFVPRDWKFVQAYVATDNDSPQRFKVLPEMVGFEVPEYA